VSTALNLPGPAACARLRALGAKVKKVEPPSGDPMESFNAGWYRRLHDGIDVRRLDLKGAEGRSAMAALLEDADLLVTAQRASALSRMGLDAATLAPRHPRLCIVSIVGHPLPHDETPGHDLTYLAEHGLVAPPALPRTLFADMAGSERAVSTALALVIARDRGQPAQAARVALAEAAEALAQPLAEGLTCAGSILGGGRPGYNLYAAKRGWIAVAALEPHFEKRLAESLALPHLTQPALAAKFALEDAQHWERWARERDLPIVAVRETKSP
jgi:alpha-methylacyl-CoA racemase